MQSLMQVNLFVKMFFPILIFESSNIFTLLFLFPNDCLKSFLVWGFSLRSTHLLETWSPDPPFTEVRSAHCHHFFLGLQVLEVYLWKILQTPPKSCKHVKKLQQKSGRDFWIIYVTAYLKISIQHIKGW